MTTCLFFFIRANGFFSPRFWWDAREKKKKLLPFQCPFVALPVMCDPVLFDFICSLSSLLFTVIYWSGHAEKLDIYFKWHWETTVSVSIRTYEGPFFKDSCNSIFPFHIKLEVEGCQVISLCDIVNNSWGSRGGAEGRTAGMVHWPSS